MVGTTSPLYPAHVWTAHRPERREPSTAEVVVVVAVGAGEMGLGQGRYCEQSPCSWE